ncbi:von Willebrand factor D and EGF domain-containing protein-like [Ruditapes philippinarum]|uniref:von Willebrand factor D and EGF domain-containing protein-like n=1 Tax=Ruditapes philippinarum TaxID=129788 RepID=UPI00295B6C86|nr:von Willebrand factor D and EGF domain-containing protein-like [Ruditapes philippinarum]
MVYDIVNDVQAKCGVIISGFLPKHDGSQQMKNVSLSLTSPFFSNSDPTEYRLTLRTSGNHQHKIWKDALLPEMQLNIIVDERFESNICYSHVDPHMCTCDGRTYENNSFNGSFILYYHDSGIQVQMKTTPCNDNRAYCACAVAVRAGGDVFLINRCGGLRFIDMTSCKDGGVLIVRKNSEVDYQVQTNIGTLIKITLLTGDYANMMNIDIHMAPKDLDRIKGLCGTFDKNKNNDFHDRNGATVSVNKFLDAWTLKNTDVDLLTPTCNLNVSTWTADNQALYCTCRCHDTEYDCGAPEVEARCSPSQYVNCTVSNSKTSELCEYFNKRCYIPLRAKRDEKLILKQDPEIEMRRLAARANLPDKFIAKREVKRDVDEFITEEMARSECTDYLHTEVIEQKSELLGPFNLSQAIEECTWDVNIGQDRGWMETHKQAALSAI